MDENKEISVVSVFRVYKGFVGVYIPALRLEIYADDITSVTAKAIIYVRALVSHFNMHGLALTLDYNFAEAEKYKKSKKDYVSYLTIV